MNADYDACERFLFELQDDYLKDYEAHLLTSLKPASITRHIIVLRAWTAYICQYKSLSDFSGLTVALCRSQFFNYFRSYNDDNLAPVTVYNIVLRFLIFVQEQYGIANKPLMTTLRLRSG